MQKLRTLSVMDNGFKKVVLDLVKFPNGSVGTYVNISNSDSLPNWGVSVIPLYKGKIVIADQVRYGCSKSTEIVKGFGMTGKTPEETAAIEIKEEIGGEISKLTKIGSLRSGGSDTMIHCFVAEIESLGETCHEASEDISNIRSVSLSEIKDLILDGKITDIESLSCLSLYLTSQV